MLQEFVGMPRYLSSLEQARKENRVGPLQIGDCDGKPASQTTLAYLGRKAKKAAKAKVAKKKKTKKQERIDLFVVCQLYEKGEMTLEQLLKAADGVSLNLIHEWYIQEGIHRELVAAKARNGG